MSDQLKPCPFCGGKAELWMAHEGRTAWIACMSKCSVLVSKEYKTDAEAIAAWNRRAIPAVQVAVKPLKWVEIRPDQYFESRVIGILYSVRLGTDGVARWQAGHMGTWHEAPTIEAAKAAAQVEYEARIRSALTVAPAPDAALVEALVEALRVNLTFSEKIAEAADIDLDETALSVLIQPRGETVARRTWAGVIGEGYAAIAPFTKGGDA